MVSTGAVEQRRGAGGYSAMGFDWADWVDWVDSAALAGTATQPANPVINLTGTAGAAAGGTITFKLYGPNDCTTLAYTSATVPVSGNGTYNSPAPQFVPTLTGSYHWVAVYSGNSPNTNTATHNAGCTDANCIYFADPG